MAEGVQKVPGSESGLLVPWARLGCAKGTRGWVMAGARAAAAASAGPTASSNSPPPQEPGLGELLEEFSRTQYRAKDCGGTGGSKVSPGLWAEEGSLLEKLRRKAVRGQRKGRERNSQGLAPGSKGQV